MNEEFPDFNDSKVRERLRMKYHAGLVGYTSLDVNYKEKIKMISLLGAKNANPKALLELLDSCLSGSEDFEGAR